MARRLTDREMAANVLERTGIRISGTGRWTQGRLARDRRGRPIGSCDPAACQWSLRGAVHYELNKKEMSERRENKVYLAIFRAVEEAQENWEQWHDEPDRTCSHVLRMLDRAIIKLGGRR